jgi:hypothetical protein
MRGLLPGTAFALAGALMLPQAVRCADVEGGYSSVTPAIRPLLQPGQLNEALARVREALGTSDGDPRRLCALGDAMFRQSRFEEAEAAYSYAVRIDPGYGRAHLGLGRIANLLSKRERAREQFATAFRLDPRDPDIILAFSSIVPDRESRRILFRNFLVLAKDADPALAADVISRLAVDRQLGSRTLATLDSPYQAYRLPLASFRPAGSSTNGLLLAASINGGKPLRLVVDSGASGIILNPAAPAGSRLELLSQASIGGFGGSNPASATIALAQTVEAGEWKIQNVLIQASDRKLAPGADGIIGLDVFQDFLIRLDLRSHVLELLPFEGASGSAMSPAYRLDHLLLLRGTVNGHAEGYFILDTGSAVSVVSRDLVPPSGNATALLGAQGEQSAAMPAAPVSIRVGGQQLLDFEYASLDTREISRHHGTRISGAIGYSLLRDFTLTINYRDGLVRMEKSARR